MELYLTRRLLNSGAGKTSLLNILAGRAASRGRVSIKSDVRLNNFAVDPTDIKVRQHIAFVAQDDSLQVTSTPREAIYFSAKLRLPRATPEKNLVKLVNKMLRELGLEHCADTYIGGALVKGISGGERKRTSVGVELVVRPAMVFLGTLATGSRGKTSPSSTCSRVLTLSIVLLSLQTSPPVGTYKL